jgi:L-threonate 2-dehydrogenase
MASTAVGVIGAGRMGGAFATLLTRAGYHVSIVDPSAERQRAAAANGCEVVDDVAALVQLPADPILLSLPTDDAFVSVASSIVRECTRANASPCIVDLSTLHPSTKQRAAADLGAIGVTLLDCPVSGTGAQALVGDVVAYLSGPEAAARRVERVLECFTRRVHYVGPFGTGSAIKLLANLLVGVHNAAAAEMIALAQRAGVDASVALDAIIDGAGQSRMLEQRGPGMVSGDYGYGASVDLFRKDLGIIGAFASGAGAWTPLLDVVTDLYERAAELGLGQAESAAVHRVYVSRVSEGRA